MTSRGRNKSRNLKLIVTAALTIFWLVTLYLIFQIGGPQSLLPKDGKIHQEILISHNFKKLRRNWTERRRNDGCSMANCFNFTRCLDMEKFRVFVHPDRENLNQTSVYAAILKIIRESHYFTSNPEDACLFIMSIDTTDRDRISENYLKNINNHIASLPKDLWNDGLNHLIFNLYFGTYPDYTNNDLGFDSKKAMIAWASSSRKNFRHDFDISLPLFHKQHPQRVERKDLQLHFPGHDQYLVSFKGKRYVYGIGSETRAMLHHLHNNRTMIMLTTCRHNTDWKKFEDQRCVVDNAEYDRWDYDALMANSTFCLVPRGRRLGSFRFLESLRSSCIPVVLSDGWVLPFEEIIDWSEAAIIGNEKSVLFIYNYLSEFSEFRVLKMRQAAQMIYESHFASIERIVFTTFEIIMERIRRNLGMPSQNSSSNSPALRNHRE